MIILAIRTDKPEAELYLLDDEETLQKTSWQAHRQLAETIHGRIAKLLNKSSISIEELDGIVCYKGPGSFTGLRIGLSVANTMSYSAGIPVVAADGKNWIEDGVKRLQNNENDSIALPKYGAPASTTSPKK